MTFADAKKSAASFGMEIKKTEYDEYRVNFKGGKEATAYYTDDLLDALKTAYRMAYDRSRFGKKGNPSIKKDKWTKVKAVKFNRDGSVSLMK